MKEEKDAKRPRLESIADDNDPHDVKVEEEKLKVEYSNKAEEETVEMKREIAEASEDPNTHRSCAQRSVSRRWSALPEWTGFFCG